MDMARIVSPPFAFILALAFAFTPLAMLVIPL